MMAEPTPFNAWQALIQGLGAVFADRRWPLKVGIGGALMLTIVGIIFPQGFLIEHLENSRRGFRTPLPLWHQWMDKAVMGLLAVVFDFVYFLLPIIVTLVLLFCAIFPLLFDADSSGRSAVVMVVALALVLGLSFSLSFSPLAKVGFSKEGEIDQNIGGRLVRRALDPLNRGLYRQARLATLPLYLPALLLGGGLFELISRPGSSVWLVLLVAWLSACTLFWAWLVVNQVYLGAVQIAEDRDIDRRLAARRQSLDGQP
jgi:hypothetical protein